MSGSDRDRQALEKIANARRVLDEARQMFGNDHPVYPKLQVVIDKTYEVERAIERWGR